MVAVAAGGIGRSLRSRFSVTADRAAITLPPAADPAGVVPAGVELGVEGVMPFITPNADFYRVDTALVAPQIRPGSWKLDVGGMVDRPFTLSYEDLLDRPLVERDITLICVSNEVGGRYAGTARWLGVPLRDVLLRGRRPSRAPTSWSAGRPTAGPPVRRRRVVIDGRDALVAIGMNGEPLPVSHGFPARLVVPGLYGFVSATKWLAELELTTFDAFDPYWVRRGWAKQAPIKTMARIDTPRGAGHGPGRTGGRRRRGLGAAPGHRRVEVRVDGGAWQPARLGDVPSSDTWRQWVLEWDAPPGRHTLDRAGHGRRRRGPDRGPRRPIPDGASGWHSIVVIVDHDART